MRSLLLVVATLCAAVAAAVPPTLSQIASDPEITAGIYRSYHYIPAPQVSAPKGYSPFYISHYGRHGSRWLSSESSYVSPRDVLRAASTDGVLTPLGVQLLERVERLAADADGRWGDLSPRGEQEHRGIAERMFAAYPEVFSTENGRECRIDSRSTQVPRCILSMAAFNERLKELNPAIRTMRQASQRDLSYLSHRSGMRAQLPQVRLVYDSMRRVRIAPQRFMEAIFADTAFLSAREVQPHKLMTDLFQLAANAQDVSYLGVSLHDFFTPTELLALWECENAGRYLAMGPSARFGDTIILDAKPLLRNMVTTANDVVEGCSDLAASLRFGHDVNVVPLLALMGIEGASARVWAVDDIAAAWQTEQVTSMGVNLQLIFFRNAAGAIRVRVLHNERDARLPVAGGPYYPWPALRDYLLARCR